MRIATEPLTAAAFAPFGDLLDVAREMPRRDTAECSTPAHSAAACRDLRIVEPQGWGVRKVEQVGGMAARGRFMEDSG
jgi:ureidoglycolate hydrolase